MERAGLYLVPEERLGELALVAADAYRDYPLHNWFTAGTYDPEASRLIMMATLVPMAKNAVIYADSEALNGFAVWAPLGFTGSKALPFMINGGSRLLLHSGPGTIRRLLTYERFAMRLKKKYTGHVDCYLYNLSVRRQAQGQGIGRRLLAPMLDFCDDENMVAYLETNKPANVELYRRFGYRLKETNTVPGSSVDHFSMVRLPVPRPGACGNEE